MAEFLRQCGSWGVLATLAAYALGMWVNRKTGRAIFNPLLLGSIFVIVFLRCFGVPYADYSASAAPVNWLLAPATVSLAIPLYEKWELLRKNLAAILAGTLAGTLTSLGSIVAMAWLMKMERAHAVTLLPKSVTTAIGMDIAETLGGKAALASAVIILTGIAGSLLAETVCKVCHITDPLAKGLALGTSAHAVGTSKALQMGEVEGAISGLAIAVAGIMTAVLAPAAANFLP
ncbi:MAG TPA: LrgB family protein [Candidatus Gemmiger excrementavium]|uniref:LrgB family protein n=1 Tax=Candidatus Gemmiger excrementavium TaxID=2838608 RepID=A0A9D2JHD9_9FIRM|nr:LrgB family protein [Candidatus Gemmiger excrementavium]